MKSYPLKDPFVISPRAICRWLHSSGWFQESDSDGSFYIEDYRSADEIQSIVEHLRKFQGPKIRIRDIEALLVPRVSVPDEPVSTEAPYFDELSILTKTPVDDIISDLVSWEDRLRWEDVQAASK